tara:strand:+ start:11815 stop:12381 length:567 start_codon:yes stop_codon:yes gene_type:complete
MKKELVKMYSEVQKKYKNYLKKGILNIRIDTSEEEMEEIENLYKIIKSENNKNIDCIFVDLKEGGSIKDHKKIYKKYKETDNNDILAIRKLFINDFDDEKIKIKKDTLKIYNDLVMNGNQFLYKGKDLFDNDIIIEVKHEKNNMKIKGFYLLKNVKMYKLGHIEKNIKIISNIEEIKGYLITNKKFML